MCDNFITRREKGWDQPLSTIFRLHSMQRVRLYNHSLSKFFILLLLKNNRYTASYTILYVCVGTIDNLTIATGGYIRRRVYCTCQTLAAAWLIVLFSDTCITLERTFTIMSAINIYTTSSSRA